MSLERIDKLFNFEKGSLQSSKCTPGQYDFVTAASEWKTHNDFTHDGEYLIFAAAAAGSLGRTHYVNGKFITSDLCFVLSPKNPVEFPIDIQFYHIIFRELRKDIVASTKAGTSKESISLGSFGKYELPYFPIEKQFETKSRFVDAELTRDELTKSFDDQLDFVSQLRQAFLREAMQGKLVPQDETDEPAEILLKKIKAEKAKLIAEKKIKKEKPLPEIKPEEIPFEIPTNWAWCRFGEIALQSEAGSSFKCSDREIIGNEWGVVKTSSVTSGFFRERENKFLSLAAPADISKRVQAGDLLFCRASGSKGLAGKCCIVPDISRNLLLSDKTIRFQLSEFVDNTFVWLVNNSEFGEGYYNSLNTGKSTSMNNVTRPQINSLPFPLPPQAEQKRIVEKLEKLLAFCDELEANVRQSKHHAETLLQVALKEALEPS